MKLVIDASEEDTSSKVGSGVAEHEEEDRVEEEPQCLNYCNRASWCPTMVMDHDQGPSR